MNSKVPTREEAFELLKSYNKSDSLIKHALAVEGVMRYMARKRGEDEEIWGIIGLIHDLDYEQFPEEHCQKTEEILKENNWPAEYIRAKQRHQLAGRTAVDEKKRAGIQCRIPARPSTNALLSRRSIRPRCTESQKRLLRSGTEGGTMSLLPQAEE